MFRTNKDHPQSYLISNVKDLLKKHRKRLDKSWAGVSAKEIFRKRVSRYMQESGLNMIEQAFEQVTNQQISAYHLKTGRQRMDSTMIASNIREMSRLQLLVEVLQRVQRMLSAADQERYAKVFAPFILGHAGQFVYHLKGRDTSTHLHKIGELMQLLLAELHSNYGDEPVYQVMKRVSEEHFLVDTRVVIVKQGEELSASSTQSTDDLEATFRLKAGKSYRGYAVNITETYDPDNLLQLITKVQVASNTTDDAQLLVEALPDLKQRTDRDNLYTDGGHVSPQSDQVMNDHQVSHIQTTIWGRPPSPEKLHLSDFEIKQTDTGKPVQITCPTGQHVPVRMGGKRIGYVASYEAAHCQACVFHKTGQYPTRPGKRDPSFRLYFSQSQAHVSQRRRRNKEHQKEGRNIRAAVEATVREVKHPFPAGKLPVRGGFRVTCMIFGSATMTNVRRIKHYLLAQKEQEERKKREQNGQSCFLYSRMDIFFTFLLSTLMNCRRTFSPRTTSYGC